MAKQESVDFQELFGASTVRESLDATAPVIYRKPEPALPTDNDLWPFTPASPTGTPNTVQDFDFIKTISGWEAPVVRPTPAPDLGKKILADAGRYFQRVQALDKKQPRRRQEISVIVDRWAREHGVPSACAPELARVKESCASFLREVLMEA